MPGALATLNIKDAGGTSRSMKVWDFAGDGSGPFAFAHVMIDGVNNVDAVGEVQTTPSANTMLARLKAISDVISGAIVADSIPYKNVSAGAKDQIKGSAGKIYWMFIMNMSASVQFLHLYNSASAGVTVGTTTPVLTFPIPTLGTTNGMGFTMHFPSGINFDTGITLAVTTTLGGTTAPSANSVIANLGYS